MTAQIKNNFFTKNYWLGFCIFVRNNFSWKLRFISFSFSYLFFIKYRILFLMGLIGILFTYHVSYWVSFFYGSIICFRDLKAPKAQDRYICARNIKYFIFWRFRDLQFWVVLRCSMSWFCDKIAVIFDALLKCWLLLVEQSSSINCCRVWSFSISVGFSIVQEIQPEYYNFDFFV